MEHLTTWFNAERGRRASLAAHLSLTPAAITQWTRVPVDRLDQVAEFTGIPKHDLRPDVFLGYIPEPAWV